MHRRQYNRDRCMLFANIITNHFQEHAKILMSSKYVLITEKGCYVESVKRDTVYTLTQGVIVVGNANMEHLEFLCSLQQK